VILLLALACAHAGDAPILEVGPKRVALSGVLRAAWWVDPPTYGESPSDACGQALVLDLDEPVRVSLEPARAALEVAEKLTFPSAPVEVRSVVYVHDLEQDFPDAAAATCIGRHARITGSLSPSVTKTAVTWATLVDARVESCEDLPPPVALPLPLGPATLSGVVSLRYAYGKPNYGETPGPDKEIHFATLELASPVRIGEQAYRWLPFTGDGLTPEQSEQFRRATLGCQGQPVVLAGEVAIGGSERFEPRYKLMNARFQQTCAAPALFRGVDRPPKPMPGWIEASGADR
jgi:hypothetical protein